MRLASRALVLLAWIAPFFLAGVSGAASGEQRVALVIGNSAYGSSPLLNPVNDARAVAKSLRELGFTVALKENLGYKAMGNAIRDFGRELAKGGGVGLFFYAGHGMQVKGRNYLIPVDAEMQHEDDIPFNAVDAGYVLEKMDSARNRLNLVILDACRNNPFARAFRSSSRGLAQMDAPSGTLVAFATAPGATASDGEGANGVYTKYLLRAMAAPGQPVEQVFKQVRVGVMRETNNLQVPWESSSLQGDFYFREGPPAAVQPSSATDPAAFELSFWDSIKQSADAADFQAYLDQFPNGRFVRLAQGRLARLQGGAPAGTARVPAPLAMAKPASGAVSALPRVGDRWVYEVVDNYRKAVVGTYAVRALRVQDGEVAESIVSELDTPLRERRIRVDSPAMAEVFSLRGTDVLIAEFAPYLTATGAMEPGRKITTSFAVGSGACDGTAIIEPPERVKVPAGEFDAVHVRIDCSYPAQVNFSAVRNRLQADAWYAPSVHRLVKMEKRVSAMRAGDNDVIQLREFSLAE